MRAPATAKLRVPGPPAWDLERPHLLRRLDGVLRHRLVSVVGGAGFGKSTVLAAWARSHPSAWYTLDAGDRRVATLAAGLVGALRATRPAASEALAMVLMHGQGAEGETDEVERARSLAGLISDALAEHPGPDEALILDDLEQVDDSAPAIRLIESLIRLAPSDLHVVLASRRRLPFAVDRLRGQGQLLEVLDDALAFSQDEVATLLTRIVGAGGADVASVVHATTDGWPAAVILAAQALA